MSDHREDNDGADLEINALSAVERMVRQREEKKEAVAKLIDNDKEWSDAVNRIATSPDGALLRKYMLMHNKLFSVDKTLNGLTLVDLNGRQAVFKELIFKYLSPANKALIMQNS